MRSVIVTGASRGLGLAIAQRLVADSFRVIAVARKSSAELDAAMATTPEALHFAAFDLSDVDAIPEFVRGLKSQFGTSYGLVNNAGTSVEGVLANLSAARIEALIRLNTLSPILLTKAITRGMLAKGEGRVINMASIVASTGFSGLAAYAATKASLVGFTRSLAREVGRVGVTVNAVAPGFIATELTAGMDEAERARVAARSALKRLAEAEDVASAVAYLMSDDARNVTGTVLTVDAGGTA